VNRHNGTARLDIGQQSAPPLQLSIPTGFAAPYRGRGSNAIFGTQARIVLFCYLALLPVLALFAYVRVVPIGFSALLSFYKWNLINPRKTFIGLANYAQLIGDENFQLALKNTTIYSLSAVILSAVITLPLALFLARRSRWSAFYQTVYFLPVITPMVPMAIAWKWIYDYNYGILNYGLSLIGIEAVPWLTDPQIALWALIIMAVWKMIGYNLIIFLVGLRNIPAMYLEAASLDGASPLQRFWHVTLPMLRPILLYVLVTSTINSFNVFTQVYVMTLGSQSAPGQAVRVLVFDIYQNGFQYFHMGYASAEAMMLTFIVLAFTFFQFRLVRSQRPQEL
jgi:multiple sugar transport system permease protein